jgi:hypothetical protein
VILETGQSVRGQDQATDEPLEFVADQEQTLSDSTIMILGLDSGESVDLMGGVNLQCEESVLGIDITRDNQQVVPLDDGSVEVVTLE